MKTLRLAFAALSLFIAALPALADVTVTVAQNAKKDAIAQSLVDSVNARTCTSLGLAATCTAAEAKVKNPNAVVYASPNAFFSDVLKDVVNRALKEYQEAQNAGIGGDMDLMSNAQKNQVCALRNAVNPAVPATGCWK